MPLDPALQHVRTVEGPATSAFAVVPADADLQAVTRALYIGTGGDLVVTLADDGAPVLLAAVQSGTLLPIRAKRVGADTTATDIVALL